MPLPSTPLEVLDIANHDLRLQIDKAIQSEKTIGFDKKPREDLSALLEEMTIDDMVDWACRSLKPVTQMDEQLQNHKPGLPDKLHVGLPIGFDKKTSITFSAAGDLLYYEGLEKSCNILYKDVEDILFDKTISFANFESPVTSQPLIKEVISDRAAPIECCNRNQFNTLASHQSKSFTILNGANNHMYDMGSEGIETTLQAFKEKNIVPIGINSTPTEAQSGIILQTNGIKLGFVSYTFGLNGHALPTEEKYRINTAQLLSKYSNPEIDPIIKQIESCKQQDCDFIFASLHWGYEFEFFPRKKQIDAVHEIVEQGADAILCHHPHVIQPVEHYRTKRDPNRIATIAYSLGSLTWGFTAAHLALSLIQNLTITKGELDGTTRTYIEDASAIPVCRSTIEDGSQRLTKIQKLYENEDELLKSHSVDNIALMKRYAELVLG